MSANAHNLTILPTNKIGAWSWKENKNKHAKALFQPFIRFAIIIQKINRLHNIVTLQNFIQWNIHQYNHYHLFWTLTQQKNYAAYQIQCLAKESIPELFSPLDPIVNVSSKALLVHVI